MIIVVEEIEIIPPKNKLSIELQPKACPVIKPIPNIKRTSVTAVTVAPRPTANNFLKLNSKPKQNNKMITPISAQILIASLSCTVGKKLTSGPTKKPATKYPKTTG